MNDASQEKTKADDNAKLSASLHREVEKWKAKVRTHMAHSACSYELSRPVTDDHANPI